MFEGRGGGGGGITGSGGGGGLMDPQELLKTSSRDEVSEESREEDLFESTGTAALAEDKV